MKFSKEERTLLINLYEIRKALALQKDSKSKEAEYCEEKIEIFKHGYEVFYDVEALVSDDRTMTKEECEFVKRLLTMYQVFDQVYTREGKNLEDSFATFWGFNENDTEEIKYAWFADFLINKRKDYPALGGCRTHSGVPTLRIYKSILDVWVKDYSDKCIGPGLMKTEHILNILEKAK